LEAAELVPELELDEVLAAVLEGPADEPLEPPEDALAPLVVDAPLNPEEVAPAPLVANPVLEAPEEELALRLEAAEEDGTPLPLEPLAEVTPLEAEEGDPALEPEALPVAVEPEEWPPDAALP
jgi:hypothetical protein